VVATDHEDIVRHCQEHRMNVVLTSPNCMTGTDRVAEVARMTDADVYINVQGDEPLIHPGDIRTVIQMAAQHPGEIINGYAAIKDDEQYRSLTVPKVVFRLDGRLLYMSRTGIPGNKKGTFELSWKQVCVYAFPREALARFTEYGKKTTLEEQEDIEILRFLEIGYEVRMTPLSSDSVAVDTQEDVEKVKKLLEDEN
jgi:3-deoxy-manno-octulosonate cytidylyltransferase (CMP-KDO synthetase)